MSPPHVGRYLSVSVLFSNKNLKMALFRQTYQRGILVRRNVMRITFLFYSFSTVSDDSPAVFPWKITLNEDNMYTLLDLYD